MIRKRNMNPKNRYILRFILRPVLGLITGYTAGKSGVTTVMKKIPQRSLISVFPKLERIWDNEVTGVKCPLNPL